MLLLWQDVDSVDWDADELLQLPLNRSTLDRPILFLCDYVHSLSTCYQTHSHWLFQLFTRLIFSPGIIQLFREEKLLVTVGCTCIIIPRTWLVGVWNKDIHKDYFLFDSKRAFVNLRPIAVTELVRLTSHSALDVHERCLFAWRRRRLLLLLPALLSLCPLLLHSTSSSAGIPGTFWGLFLFNSTTAVQWVSSWLLSFTHKGWM